MGTYSRGKKTYSVLVDFKFVTGKSNLFSSTTRLGRHAVGELRTACFLGDSINFFGDFKLDFAGKKLTCPGEHGYLSKLTLN